jgi:hypothetical protein
VSISLDHVEIIERIADRISIPRIKDTIVPKKESKQNKSNFAAVALKNQLCRI